MATETSTSGGFDSYRWLSGIVAGLIGAIVTGLVIQFGFDPDILSEGIPEAFGLSGMAQGWVIFLLIGAVLGILYTAVGRIDQVGTSASRPESGAIVGLAYGVVIWILAVILVPLAVGNGTGDIGEYAVNMQGILSFALLGILIGIAYAVSPYT